MKSELKLNYGVPTLKGKDGYIRIKCGEIWVLEHKLVVENFIKRPLRKEETIHHLNHKRDDNRLENLMLFPNQKAHKHFENQVAQFGLTNHLIKQIETRWNQILKY